ncbi:DUF6503 family protein [Winogradskyella helgolandensis]|uniref:DUF6503 family protein n=1 Tax=Winogradskyella helgolandensis TaxID=2697010 RepID=UPI0015B903A8|nr:DUF6503 family protein [Winogradskyella helgolandensis]
MKFQILFSILLTSVVLSCKNDNPKPVKDVESKTTPEVVLVFQNKGHELVYNMVQNVGDYSKLSKKKDVVYTYTYETPDGQTDISTEKYIFDGELSYGAYSTHQRTLANLTGLIEQGYDGETYWLKQDGNSIEDEASLKKVAFNRPTNFYWFAMFQKLLDPGVNYEFVEEQIIDDNTYNIVKVSFESNNDEPKDIYQLYINKETNLVDQFLFTVADFGRMDTPSLMKVKYEKIDDLLIPTKRQYKRSNWSAEESELPWIKVSWTNIKFNNNLSQSDFEK